MMDPKDDLPASRNQQIDDLPDIRNQHIGPVVDVDISGAFLVVTYQDGSIKTRPLPGAITEEGGKK